MSLIIVFFVACVFLLRVFVSPQGVFRSEHLRTWLYSLLTFCIYLLVLGRSYFVYVFVNKLRNVFFWIWSFFVFFLDAVVMWRKVFMGISCATLIHRVSFYVANKADLVWYFFLKKKHQLTSYRVSTLREAPVFFF